MVTVIIPTYNRASTIKRAVESVLEQSYSDIEIIIVDDGSEDNTYEIVHELQRTDDRIVFIRHENNKGACAARNTGILNAKGEFIAFQDSDDIWLKNKLSEQMLIMKKEDVDVCFCKMKFYRNGKLGFLPTNYVAGIQSNLTTVFGIGTVTLLFRREVLLENLFDEKMPRLQEFELMLRLAKKYKIYFLDEPLVQREFSVNSISKQNEALIRACDLILEKYPSFKKDYSLASYQLAKVLIRNANKENILVGTKMILKALELDCSLRILLRIPYYYLFER